MRFLFFSILLFFFTSSVIAGGWKTFGCDVFSISYPNSWESVSTGHGTAVAIFTRKVDDPAQQPYAENLHIVYDIITQNEPENLAVAADASFSEFGGLVPDLSIIKKGYIQIGPYKGYEMVFSGNLMDLELKWKQVFIRQKHAWFIITYTGFGENFNRYESTADNMIASFRIK